MSAKLCLPQVTRNRWQIAAGENFAFVGNEAHARSRQAALRHGVHVAGMASRMSAVTHRWLHHPA